MNVKIVEINETNSSRERRLNFPCSRFQLWTDFQSITNHERRFILTIEMKEWELKEEWSDDSTSKLRCFKEFRVHVTEVFHSLFQSSNRHVLVFLFQVINFMRDATSLIVMVLSKWIECCQLMPSSAKFIIINGLRLVLKESANICPNHWNSKHVHVKHSTDWVSHELPSCPVVSCPMSCELTWSWEGRSWKNERSFLVCVKSDICLFSLFVSIKRMEIVLYIVVILGAVLSVKWDCLVLKICWLRKLRIEDGCPVSSCLSSFKFVCWTFTCIIRTERSNFIHIEP